MSEHKGRSVTRMMGVAFGVAVVLDRLGDVFWL